MKDPLKNGSLTYLINNSINDLKQIEFRNYIGASSIGNPCWRAIWYKYYGYDSCNFSPKQLRNFAIGHKLEGLILDLLESAGLKLSRDWFDLFADDLPIFKGHIDAMWLYEDATPRAIIEIKTARDSSFNVFVNKGLQIWSPTYYAQIQSYMGMSEVHGAYLVALNKDTSDLHDEYVLFDKDFYDQLKLKAKSIVDSGCPPAKINNSPLFYICRNCAFKSECHR